jgi:hypothetical protein
MSGLLTSNLIVVGTPNGASISMELEDATSLPDIILTARALTADCQLSAPQGARLLCVVNVTFPDGTGVSWQSAIASRDADVVEIGDWWREILGELIAGARRPRAITGTPIGNAPTTDTPQ